MIKHVYVADAYIPQHCLSKLDKQCLHYATISFGALEEDMQWLFFLYARDSSEYSSYNSFGVIFSFALQTTDADGKLVANLPSTPIQLNINLNTSNCEWLDLGL